MDMGGDEKAKGRRLAGRGKGEEKGKEKEERTREGIGKQQGKGIRYKEIGEEEGKGVREKGRNR